MSLDPLTTKNIFASELPLTLVPLNACNYVVMSPDYIATHFANIINRQVTQ